MFMTSIEASGGQKRLDELFEKYLQRESIFKNKDALSISYEPEKIFHRDEQIETLSRILAPVLRKEKPSNIFIYGLTGTGKTLVTRYVTRQLKRVAEKYVVPLKVLEVNCKMKKVADTEYRLLAYLCSLLGRDVPATGLPTDEVYKTFFSLVENCNSHIILILDEIDALVKKTGDEILYNLTRISSDGHQNNITIIGISNDLSFMDWLDARVRSSLSEEEVIFPPYDANQLKDILEERARIAFNPGKIDEAVISKCAALAAQEHGDARRALDLLRIAGELAERNNDAKVEEKHVDMAEEMLDMDRMVEATKTLPKQSKLVLYSILTLLKTNKMVLTGDVQRFYESVCKEIMTRPLTQRRVSDIIAELDMLGLINAAVISKGRYGRTREISLSVSPSIHEKMLMVLKEELDL